MKKIIMLVVLCLFLEKSFAQNGKIELNHPTSMVIDSKNNVFVGEKGRLIKITPNGEATIFKDVEKIKTNAFNIGYEIMTIDKDDNIYSCQRFSGIIYKTTSNGIVTNYLGTPPYEQSIIDGNGAAARFREIKTLDMGLDGKILVSDRDQPTAMAGKRKYFPSYEFALRSIDKDLNVKTVRYTEDNEIKWIFPVTNILATKDSALIFGGNYCIKKKIKTATKDIAGQYNKYKNYIQSGKGVHYHHFVLGDTGVAEFQDAHYLNMNSKGEIIFVNGATDRILKLANNTITWLAGGNDISSYLQVISGGAEFGYKDGKAKEALFSFIKAMKLDSKDNLFILDTQEPKNGKVITTVRKLSTDGVVSTFYK
jgi:hypothetical protein